jgi:GntR family transcriptional repressor for pyruvate dehydrogenase complex
MLRDRQRGHLYEAVAVELKQYIADHGLQAGDRLPSEHDLCTQLSVGRSSLREALRVLQMSGLIEIKVGRGIFVRQDELAGVVTRSTQPFLGKGADFLDLLEVRELLEVQAVALACERRSRLHLQKLEHQLQSDEAKVAQGVYGLEEDLDFHRLLFEAAGNKALIHFVALIDDLRRSLALVKESRVENQVSTLQEHTSIYEAVRDRKARRAASEMQTHVRSNRRMVAASSETRVP